MKSLTSVLHARISEAEIRKTSTGKDYLSIKAELLDDAKAEKCGPVWVTSFHKSHIAAGLSPGMRIRVDGALDVQRYEKDGEKRVSLRLTADDLTIMVEATEGPLAGAQAAGEKTCGHSHRETKPSARTEIASSLLDQRDGTAISASRSESSTCQHKKPVQPANNLAAGRDSISTTLIDTPSGSASTAFDPKNKPKLPPEQIAALSMPAAKSTGKRHERPFDDPMPF